MILRCLQVLFLLFLLVTSPVFAQENVLVLNYHDVNKNLIHWTTVTKENLITHFEYLRDNGYNPISLQQYVAACRNKGPLPEKPVLLTFDDGYLSFYNEVFPLLQEYQYPAVIAIVPSWLDGDRPADVGELVTWEQVRQMEASGWVTVASHSYNLHNYIPINKFGDRVQAVSALQYLDNRNETLVEYQRRIREDMEKSQRAFEQELGHSVSAMVWPYGEYTNFAIEQGRKAGMEVFFALAGGINSPSMTSLLATKRIIMHDNPDIEAFKKILATGGDTIKPLRVAQLDIDVLYDEDMKQTEENINRAIDRYQRMHINTVFLQAFSDMRGTGNIESVYFQTSVAPVKANIFSHITHRLHQAGFKVYAWMPTLSGQWLIKKYPSDQVQASQAKSTGWYKRATPFSREVRKQIMALYADLAAYTPIDGILFQDDLYLNDYEDVSPAAKAAFKERFNRDLTMEILQGDPTIKEQWVTEKTRVLNDLTVSLIRVVKQYRPQIATARNIYTDVILKPESQEWFAQNYQDFLVLYDYTVIMAYPFMEKQDHRSQLWLGELADTVLSNPSNASKTIFKLQTYDWNTKQWISKEELEKQVEILKAKGMQHLGYYPDHVFSEQDAKLPF